MSEVPEDWLLEEIPETCLLLAEAGEPVSVIDDFAPLEESGWILRGDVEFKGPTWIEREEDADIDLRKILRTDPKTLQEYETLYESWVRQTKDISNLLLLPAFTLKVAAIIKEVLRVHRTTTGKRHDRAVVQALGLTIRRENDYWKRNWAIVEHVRFVVQTTGSKVEMATERLAGMLTAMGITCDAHGLALVYSQRNKRLKGWDDAKFDALIRRVYEMNNPPDLIERVFTDTTRIARFW